MSKAFRGAVYFTVIFLGAAEESLSSSSSSVSSSSSSSTAFLGEIKTSKYLSRVQGVFSQESATINPLRFVCEDLYFARLEEIFSESLILQERLSSVKTHPAIRKKFVESLQASQQRPFDLSQDSKNKLTAQNEMQEMLKKIDAGQFECKIAWDLVGSSMEVNMGESQQKTLTAFYRNKAYLVCLIPDGNAIEITLDKISDADSDAASLRDALQCHKHSRSVPDANSILLALEAALGADASEGLIQSPVEAPQEPQVNPLKN